MSLEQFLEKILEMKERHVCIYGCGKMEGIQFRF